MFERFTAAAREVVVDAQESARALHFPEITDAHLLLALLGDEGVAGRVLRRAGVTRAAAEAELVRLLTPGSDAEALGALGIDLDEVRRRAEAVFGDGALDRPSLRRAGRLRRRLTSSADHLPFTSAAKRALEGALRAAVGLGHRFLGTEHLLLGVLAVGDGLAVPVLDALGVPLDAESARYAVLEELRRSA